MLFQVENKRGARSTHCGVLEFVADEGMVYMPYWMMQNLLLQEGDVVTLRSISLPKGTFVKLQPHSKDFLDISNPRAVLETTLRNFSCLTKGDTIPINYNNKKYFIDIVDAKPSDAISVIETDCNVDFAPPLDYVEPGSTSDVGVDAEMADASQSMGSQSTVGSHRGVAGGEKGSDAAEQAAVQEPSFMAFSGAGRRLDGKPVSESNPVAIPVRVSGAGADSNSGAASTSTSAPKSGSAPGSRKAGKLMFKDRLAAKYGDAAKKGDGSGAPVVKKEMKEEDKKGDDGDNSKSGFEAFKGTSYKLK